MQCTDGMAEEKMAKERHEKKAEIWSSMKALQFVAEVVQLFGDPGYTGRTGKEVLEIFSRVLASSLHQINVILHLIYLHFMNTEKLLGIVM